MLSFREMEKYCQLLQVIQGHQQQIAQYDDTLRAYDYRSGPRSSNIHADLIGEILAKKEIFLDKLPKLEALAASRRSDVERSINTAVAAAARKDQLRTALIFKMRYNSAHSWEEIANILGKESAKAIRDRVIQCIEKGAESHGRIE